MESQSKQPVLTWERRALVSADLVESVRLIRLAEANVIGRWCRFVEQVRTSLLPAHDGRLIKSQGDGLLMDFPNVRAAMHAAFGLHQLMAAENIDALPELTMDLRVGCHISDIVKTDLDIYGDGVNLVHRLAALAGPGETFGSAAWCEQLVEGIDAKFEDLGHCFVKHYKDPVRAYRLGQPGLSRVKRGWAFGAAIDGWRSGIAIVPFVVSPAGDAATATGDLIADGLILQMSATKHLRVVSRLSTSLFRDGPGTAYDIGQRLGVRYVLSGRCRVRGGRLEGVWELAEVSAESVVTAGQVRVNLADLHEPDCVFILELAQSIHDAVFRIEAQRARLRPLPNLDSYSLLLGGIQLLHRSARLEFQRSFEVLTHLSELHPRSTEPRLWLAKWYALSAVQGMTEDRALHAQRALECTSRALDAEPDNAFGLAMEAFVHCHLTLDHERAQGCIEAALELNPSETFAHLVQALLHGLRADFIDGIASAEQAVATSPLDPARYLFDSMAAYLHLGAGHHDRSVELAEASLRRNRMHAHTWRALTIALVERGDIVRAQDCVRHLMDVQPRLNLQDYVAAGQPNDPVRRRFADALGRVGVPAR